MFSTSFVYNTLKMDFLTKTLVLSLLGVVIYYCYIPVPDEMHAIDQWLMRILNIMHQFGKLLVS